MEVQREKKLYGKKAKYRGWTYLDDAELLGLPWSQKAHLAYASKHKRTYAGVKARRAKLSVSGVKTVTNLKGIRFITAEGDKISLDKYIKDTQVVEDIQELYQQEISERHRSRGRATSKGHIPKKEGVSKRVRRLTQQEIRKEYGMKDSPHKKSEGGLRADCLWLIRHNSPITASRAAEVLKKNKSSVSGIFSNLFSVLGDDFIERTPTLPYEYRPLQHYDVKVAMKELTKREREKMKEKRAKARGEEPEPKPKIIVPPDRPPRIRDHDLPLNLEMKIDQLGVSWKEAYESHKRVVSSYTTAVKELEEKVEKRTQMQIENMKELAQMIDIQNERIITLARTQQELLESGVGQGGGTQTLRVEFIFGWKK
jgi:hypothetical protein